MPFIRITTNEKIDKRAEGALTVDLGSAIECIKGKTERWLMLEFKGEAKMTFSGNNFACAMVEVDLLGAATPTEKNVLTEQLCNIINVALGVPTNRIYVRYYETDTWGYDCQNL